MNRITAELTNLMNGSAAAGDTVAVKICGDAIQEIESLQAEREHYLQANDGQKDAITNQVRTIQDLQAVVAELPKTADGVPAYPGMTVWAEKHDTIWRWKIIRMDLDGWCWMKRVEPCDSSSSLEMGTKRFYSTEAAVRAAKAEGSDDENLST